MISIHDNPEPDSDWIGLFDYWHSPSYEEMREVCGIDDFEEYITVKPCSSLFPKGYSKDDYFNACYRLECYEGTIILGFFVYIF